ncbi:MAG: BrnA antitoxin family protein [Chloroflexia bacterium]|nr:BrnA antitoxin family protein [Chloroflexia bacterium]
MEASIDFEDEGDFSSGEEFAGLPPLPPPKEQLTLRIDGDIVDWFRGTGKGYQTRINTVLRRYVEAQKRS